jgi:sterol desaturase/sphingolipid hydroxylase (fatty acid hydroxylase superfamily)
MPDTKPVQGEAIAASRTFGELTTALLCALSLFATELTLHGPLSLGRWLAALIIGWLTWTLIEYAAHRFLLHGVTCMRAGHNEHHDHPAADTAQGFAASMIFCISAVLTSLACLAAAYNEATHEDLRRGFYSGFTDASGWLAGLQIGYLAYVTLHDAIHRRPIGPGHWLYRTKLRHAAHHAGLEANFGITVSWWDNLFGTLKAV